MSKPHIRIEDGLAAGDVLADDKEIFDDAHVAAIMSKGGTNICLIDPDTRTVLKAVDGSHELGRFAARYASSVAHFWDAPSELIEYLDIPGETEGGVLVENELRHLYQASGMLIVVIPGA